ncbi:ribosomal protein S18-alanine N-acetyltransferase [Kineosporia sp. NBRC 101731]|uniref:ribosomal protein S18-alanine N-acetyltransferase n=1 Tax=Kineosporia sp. NBRC 101731 TaxID=3032199 RepID=UPI0024A0A6A6|nr:ribosomal protein S18-alanine N-acetyltransferase [Kineosporia sp. NBRC 101731]GLY27737.1 ribosomal-protein-alanine acetyltransferase [Kineosporia sp. NBRC 101731]
MSIRLRAMRWWDVEALMPLERELFGDTAWTVEMFWSELAHPETRWYVVAESAEDELLGYAGLLAPGAEADVQTVAVAPAAQGRGVGRQLLDAMIDQARSREATSLLLEVRADNEQAIRLYTRRGFERIAIRHRYYQPGDIDAWIMRLRPLRAGD